MFLAQTITLPKADLKTLPEASNHAVAIDIETDTLWRGKGPKDDFGLSYVSDPTHIAMTWQWHGETLSYVEQAPFSEEYLDAIRSLLNDPVVTVIAHNAVFDLRQLGGKLNNGVVRCRVWDTGVMARLIMPEKVGDRKGVSLKDAARMVDLQVTELQSETKSQRDKLHEMDQDLVALYCADDTKLTYDVYQKQLNALDGTGQEMYELAEWEIAAMTEYCAMSARGVKLNIPYAKARIAELRALVEQSKTLLAQDGLYDPSKREQISEYLYLTKKLPIPQFDIFSPLWTDGTRKKIKLLLSKHRSVKLVFNHDGGFITDSLHQEEILDGSGNLPETVFECDIKALATGKAVMKIYIGADVDSDDSADDEEDEDVLAIGLYKDKLKALSDYLQGSKAKTTVEGLLDHAAYDGRIHSLVTIATHTGRRASSQPQVQNLNMKTHSDYVAFNMCGILIGDDGCALVEIDEDGAENRMSATIAADSNLAFALASSDFHAHNASIYFPQFKTLEEKSEEWDRLRGMSKNITFGTAYGMGAPKLGASLGIDVSEAKRILSAKDLAFPQVTKAKELYKQRGSEQGFIRLWTGRKITVSRNKPYKAWNYGCQGGVGEIVKRSLVQIMRLFREQDMKSYVALDMHDALIVNVVHDEWEQACNIVSNIMETAVPEKLCTRTTPAITWKARPDFKKGAKKWGYKQVYPDIEVKAAPLPEPPKQPSYEIGTVRFEIADLGFSEVLMFRNMPAEQLTDIELEAAWSFFEKLKTTIEEKLETKYKAQLPNDAQGNVNIGENADIPVKVGSITEVPYATWVEVPLYWAYAGRICDTKKLINLDQEQLVALYNERKSQLDLQQSRLADTQARIRRITFEIAKRA